MKYVLLNKLSQNKTALAISIICLKYNYHLYQNMSKSMEKIQSVGDTLDALHSLDTVLMLDTVHLEFIG